MSDGLRWVFGLPRRDIEYGGGKIELSGAAAWAEVVDSIELQLSTFRPSVLREHERDGEALGYVERSRVLSKADAADLGIDQPGDEALYLGLRLTDAAASAYDAGTLRLTSPGLSFGWRDETGHTWPAYLKEISFVAVPHIKRDQVPADRLREIALRDPTVLDNDAGIDTRRHLEGAHMADEPQTTQAESAKLQGDEHMEQMMAQLAALVEQVAALTARVEAIEGKAPEQARAKDEANMSDTDTKVVELSDRVAALQSEIARRDAQAEVARVAETRMVDDTKRAKLVELRLKDKDGFALIAELLPLRPTTAPRMSAAHLSDRGVSLRDDPAAMLEAIKRRQAVDKSDYRSARAAVLAEIG